jgi:CBS domain-containing protein
MTALVFQSPPFDALTPEETSQLDAHLTLQYFPQGETLCSHEQPVEHLFWLLKGKVEAWQNNRLEAVYEAGDLFDQQQIWEGSFAELLLAREDTLCYTLPIPIIKRLIGQNASLRRFFAQGIESARQLLDQRKALQASALLATSRIHTLNLPTSHPISGDTQLHALITQLSENKGDACLVELETSLGIVTLTDIALAINREDFSPQMPIQRLAQSPVIRLSAQESMMRAQQLMLNQKLHHLVIDGPHGLSILDSRSMLAFFANQSHLMVRRIDLAQSLSELTRISQDLTPMVQTLLEQGTRTEHIMQLVSEVNRHLFIKTFSLCFPESLHDKICLFVMGSEGREEQIFRTDQDNGLILEEELDADSLIPYCTAFNHQLLAMGYPPCPGNIMLTNPLWRQTLRNFDSQIQGWTRDFHPQNSIYLSALSDAKPIAGQLGLCEKLREKLHHAIAQENALLPSFALSIQQFETPLGLFGDLSLSDDKQHLHQLDVKKGGLFVLIHGLRCLALEQGILETNSLERLKALSHHSLIDAELAKDLQEAFSFISQLRLEAMLEAQLAHEPLSNFISPSRLSRLEIHLLKACFKSIKRFKRLVEHHFHLERLG